MMVWERLWRDWWLWPHLPWLHSMGREGSGQGQLPSGRWGTWQWAERTHVPVLLWVVLVGTVIGTAGHEQPERRVGVQFGGGGSTQAGWEVMKLWSQGPMESGHYPC